MPTIQIAGRGDSTQQTGASAQGADDPGGASRPSNLRVEVTQRAGVVLGVVGEVRVRVVGDGEMAAAHLAHCGVAGTTDVITMDLRDGAGAGDREIDADLLVCVDEAARQAAARGIALAHELTLYVVHGVLHCLGFDDHDEAGFALMHAEEDRVLGAIGVGVVFARGVDGVEGAGR
jgi:probable rRNA maturation factor